MKAKVTPEKQPFQITEDESVVDFYEKTTWFEAMTRSVQRHSEFMRPEAMEDYQDMEYTYPDVLGLGGDSEFDPFEPPPDYVEWPPLNCPGCLFSGTVEIGDQGETDAQVCFPYGGVFCMAPDYYQDWKTWIETGVKPEGFDSSALASFAASMEAGTWSWSTSGGRPTQMVTEATSKRCGSCFFCLQCSGVYEAYYTQKYMIGKWDYRPWWDEVAEEMKTDSVTTVTAQFKDAYGNICTDSKTVSPVCCNDTSKTALAWDSSRNPAAVNMNVEQQLYITGGCPPYTYSVTAGSGFYAKFYPTFGTWQAEHGDYYTEAPSLYIWNVEVSSADCANLDPTITVTVTDDCSETAELELPIQGTTYGWRDVGLGYTFYDVPPCTTSTEEHPYIYECAPRTTIVDPGDANHRWVFAYGICGKCPTESYEGWTVGTHAQDPRGVVTAGTIDAAGADYIEYPVTVPKTGATTASFIVTVDGSGGLATLPAIVNRGENYPNASEVLDAKQLSVDLGGDIEVTVNLDGITPTYSNAAPCEFDLEADVPCMYQPGTITNASPPHPYCTGIDPDFACLPMGYTEQIWTCAKNTDRMDIDFEEGISLNDP